MGQAPAFLVDLTAAIDALCDVAEQGTQRPPATKRGSKLVLLDSVLDVLLDVRCVEACDRGWGGGRVCAGWARAPPHCTPHVLSLCCTIAVVGGPQRWNNRRAVPLKLWQAVFDETDADGSGSLDCPEFVQCITSIHGVKCVARGGMWCTPFGCVRC